jgi:hypothetical protein
MANRPVKQPIHEARAIALDTPKNLGPIRETGKKTANKKIAALAAVAPLVPEPPPEVDTVLQNKLSKSFPSGAVAVSLERARLSQAMPQKKPKIQATGKKQKIVALDVGYPEHLIRNVVHITEADILAGKKYHVSLDDLSKLDGIGNTVTTRIERALTVVPSTGSIEWELPVPPTFIKAGFMDEPQGSEVYLDGIKIPYTYFRLTTDKLIFSSANIPYGFGELVLSDTSNVVILYYEADN